MEEEAFETIRREFTDQYPMVEKGQMMRSPAILLKDKVFAFFSRKKKMVFKLGDDPEIENDMRPFNPFKKKGPLRGWYEVDFSHIDRWRYFAEKALTIMKNDE